jgi:hypothetical protein
MTKCMGVLRRGMAWMVLVALTSHLAAADASLFSRYARIFAEAKNLAQSQPTNAEAAWKFSRACYDLSVFATNSTQMAEKAREGIAAARSAIRLDEKLAAGHYYLGINLGQLADATRTLGGLKLVSEMERSFNKARELEAQFDYAGPDRCLGLLYRDAPGWPISVGSRSKARPHLERACELAREYPENQLNLLEAWLKWGERKKAQAELNTVEAILAEARKKLTGQEWALAWSDWDRMWGQIRKKAGEPVQPAQQPKGTR